MKRLRRLLLLFSVFVCCFAVGSASLTVSAASGLVKWNTEYVELTSCKAHTNGFWQTPTRYSFSTQSGTNRGFLSLSYGGTTATQWRALFTPLDSFPSYVVDERFLQLTLSINYWNQVANNSYGNQVITGALYLTAPDGKIYEFPITEQTSINGGDTEQTIQSYLLTISGVADVGEGFDLKDCTFEFMANGYTNSYGVDLYFGSLDFTFTSKYTDDTVQIVDSVEQGFSDLQNKIDQSTQDIIDNQNQNTQDIINNQDSNTQDIIDNENANAGKTHGFLQNIKDGIGNLVNQIVALPGKIWEVIENGLKNLFIPDQEYIAGYKSKWETLLSSRFGAVYQSFEILVDFAESITEADQTNTVSIPRVSIPMPDNNEFVFGPYYVKVVPDATVLNFLVDTCKMITAVVAVFLLVNALRRRWEEIMNAD